MGPQDRTPAQRLERRVLGAVAAGLLLLAAPIALTQGKGAALGLLLLAWLSWGLRPK